MIGSYALGLATIISAKLQPCPVDARVGDFDEWIWGNSMIDNSGVTASTG